jgi:DNA-binding PucR family transcriptional regulator
MKVDLKDALGLPILKVSKLLTDAEIAADRRITWVSVIEVPVGEFIRNGEFVLSTGMNVGHNAALLSGFVGEVAGAKASALALAIGPYTPRVPSQVVTVANRVGLPLIELPWETRFSDISEVILTRLIQDQATRRSRDEFVWSLASGGMTASEAAAAGHLKFNWNLSYVGIVGRIVSPGGHLPEPESVHLIESLCAEYARQQQLEWVHTISDGRIIGYLQAPRSIQRLRSMFAAIQERVRNRLSVLWGIGRVCRELADFKNSYEDARIACQLCSEGTGSGSITDVSDILADRILLPVYRDANAALLISRYIQPLTQTSRVPLLPTVQAFFDNDCNVSETARKLSISRQSLLNRLSNVESLLNVDLRSSENRFAICLSLRLYKLQRTLAAQTVN